MSNLSISFPNGGPAPASGGALTYCCGTYTLTDVPSGASVEVKGKIYPPGTVPDTNPPLSASPASVGMDTWNYPSGLGGASSSAGQTVRVWLIVNGTTADDADATFDPCVEGTSGCPTPAVCGREALLDSFEASQACVIDNIAPRVFNLRMDMASFSVDEPVRSLLATGVLQARPVALSYDAARSNWNAEVWSSKSGRVRLTVVRTSCGRRLRAEVVLQRNTPTGIKRPLRWYCPDFCLTTGGGFGPASARGERLGNITIQPGA
jgi:hypothetical protein